MRSVLLVAVGVVLGAFLSAASRHDTDVSAADKISAELQDEVDNKLLAEMYAADQADRLPFIGNPSSFGTWELVGLASRDILRLGRVKTLYEKNTLRTGADYYHAAMILQHGLAPEDFLLAHELSVVAISKGNRRAVWLAAATEDRFLMNLNRPQRFGTQFITQQADAGFSLYKVDNDVTDTLREAMNVPPLASAADRATELSRPSDAKTPHR